MKHTKGQSFGAVLGVTVLLALATSRAEVNEHKPETPPRLLQDTTTVGIGFSQTPAYVSASVAAAATSSVEDELVKTLERDDQVTVMSDVQLGELLCDSMTEAENATLLRFPISADEAVIAEKTSFTVLDGGGFSDGIARKVWSGKDVEGVIEGAHRTVSMTWGEECDVETFLLKITTTYDDGSLFVLKSVPCEAGSSDETCMVEVELYLKDSEEIEATTAGSHSSYDVRQLQEAISEARELQSTTTTIDVMLLYTETVKGIFGGVSDSQVMSTLATAIASSNQALKDSSIDAEFHLVYAGPLPYNETNTDIYEVLYAIRDNEAVSQLRSCTGADLVQLVGYFDGACGLGFLFNGEPDAGFSVASANCIEGFTHTHELGHNLGCFHNRENSKADTEYAHGWRYCNGSDPYRTVMSYSEDCDVPRVHFFSNPGVMLYDKPTGQENADNARAFELNMAIVADFESSTTDRSTCELPTSTPLSSPTPVPMSMPMPTPTLDLVDASERTEVTVSANAYDTRNSEESGCDPDGCVPSNTRDNTLIYDSRWSCIKYLENETCRLTYKFDEAQDIVEINIAFFKGNERTRTFEVETLDTSGDTSTTEFTSSGETDGFETFYLGSDEVTELVIFPVAPNEDDWISILEAEIMVQ